jgi:hypothetical protein
MLLTFDDRKNTLPTERVGMVVFILMDNRGKKFTTSYFAEKTGLQHHSAWEMLCKLSRVLPIIQDLDGWRIE